MSTAGAISGTPKGTGTIGSKTSSFTVKVTDANNQTATANLSITVKLGVGANGIATKAR